MAKIVIDDKEVQAKLKKFMSEDLDNYLKQAMAKACIIVEGQAKENCPVDDGILRGSLAHEVDVEEGQVVGYVGTNVEYAPYVHEGTGIYNLQGRQTPWKYKTADGEWHSTKGQKAQPFLQDAIDSKHDEVINCFKNLF